MRWESFSSDFGPKDGVGTPEFWSEYARYEFLSSFASPRHCFMQLICLHRGHMREFHPSFISHLTTLQLHDIDNLSSDWHRQNGSCCRFQQPQYTPTFFCAVCCSPLSDATAVVDERLRVLGVQRLRVADASIMPTLSSGNTHAPVVHSRGMTMLQRGV